MGEIPAQGSEGLLLGWMVLSKIGVLLMWWGRIEFFYMGCGRKEFCDVFMVGVSNLDPKVILSKNIKDRSNVQLAITRVRRTSNESTTWV